MHVKAYRWIFHRHRAILFITIISTQVKYLFVMS